MSLVDIRVDLPSYSHTFTVQVPSSSSVSQLKQQIHLRCPGQPRPEGQRLIWRGRVLTDNENIDNLWKADPRIVHLAVHPSAWSSTPPEIPQYAPTSQASYQAIPSVQSLYSPAYIYPSRATYTRNMAGFSTQLSSLSTRPNLDFVRNLHKQALHALCPGCPPAEHITADQRVETCITLENNGWAWPAVLDEPFPEPSEGGVTYEITDIDGIPYLQLSAASDGVQPTLCQQHALKILSYTLNILSLPMSNPPDLLAQQMPVPPHVNQLFQQFGLPPLRVAGNNPHPVNQNNAFFAEVREIPLRAILAPLLMLVFRTVLLLYFFAPARKPIFGILILGWMLYEIWQPIRNGLRNGWGRAPENGQQQANGNGQNVQQAAGAPLPDRPEAPGARPAHVRPANIDGQAAHIFETLANLNIEDEQRMLTPGPGGPPAEPTLGHKIVTFLTLFITTLHPAIWNRRRVALRRREGIIRTEANVRNAPPRTSDNDSEAPSPINDEAARRREQLRAQYERQPRWIQRYMGRVVAEEWVDDSD